jgi:hypothetical protein
MAKMTCTPSTLRWPARVDKAIGAVVIHQSRGRTGSGAIPHMAAKEVMWNGVDPGDTRQRAAEAKDDARLGKEVVRISHASVGRDDAIRIGAVVGGLRRHSGGGELWDVLALKTRTVRAEREVTMAQ